ncbi:MAG: histidine phosphatase family protein [Clostridia bacterium]|nr:histidine phosphatase family protein [Clostridia bacterium]
MKIFFVRHGDPDYDTDTLTELGKLQAEAAAKRLENCGIQRIFASSMGRAVATATPLAQRLSLEIETRDFIREIQCDALNKDEPILENGHPWNVANALVSMGESLTKWDWREHEPFSKSMAVNSVNKLEAGLDKWLEELGYRREGENYRVIGDDTKKTIAMFSHAGASTAAIAHMVSVPFPLACAIFAVNFTSITSIELEDTKGKLVKPMITLLNDHKHIKGIKI